MFLPNLFCISEVSDDVHQGIAACTSLVFFSGAHFFICDSLSLFGFVCCASVLRMNSYFWIVLFGSCEHWASTVFVAILLFVLRFVYLFSTSLS